MKYPPRIEYTPPKKSESFSLRFEPPGKLFATRSAPSPSLLTWTALFGPSARELGESSVVSWTRRIRRLWNSIASPIASSSKPPLTNSGKTANFTIHGFLREPYGTYGSSTGSPLPSRAPVPFPDEIGFPLSYELHAYSEEEIASFVEPRSRSTKPSRLTETPGPSPTTHPVDIVHLRYAIAFDQEMEWRARRASRQELAWWATCLIVMNNNLLLLPSFQEIVDSLRSNLSEDLRSQ